MFTNAEFYLNDYGGEPLGTGDEKELDRLLLRSERDIWCVCSEGAWNAVYGGDADERTARILKTAVCVQADSLREKSGIGNGTDGGSGAAGGAMSEENRAEQESRVISSVKLGDFSVNYDYGTLGESSSESTEKDSDSGGNEISGGNVCTEALLILDRGGFLYRGGVRV